MCTRMYVSIYIHMHVYMLYIYICIYIYTYTYEALSLSFSSHPTAQEPTGHTCQKDPGRAAIQNKGFRVIPDAIPFECLL